MTTDAGVTLNADAYVSTCNGSVYRSNLVYSWSASKNGVQDYTIVSTSKQFYSFKLSPYSLQVNALYTFTLTVLDSISLQSSSRSINALVVPSNIVSVIAGGSRAALNLGQAFTADASASYDGDKFGMIQQCECLDDVSHINLFLWCGPKYPD